MANRTGGPVPVRSPRFVRQLFCVRFAMLMVLASTLAFAQTTIDPTGRSAEPPGLLKEEFVRPTLPPSPVLPVVPFPQETGVPIPPSTVRVFVRDVRVIDHTAFSGREIAEVTPPFKNRTLIDQRTTTVGIS